MDLSGALRAGVTHTAAGCASLSHVVALRLPTEKETEPVLHLG